MHEEHISALMDDELPAPERAAAIDGLLAVRDARATWARYHLIGDALRDAAPAVPRSAEVIALPAPARPRPWVAAALAASLAAFAMSVLLQRHGPPDTGAVVATAGTPAAPLPIAPSSTRREMPAALPREAADPTQVRIVADEAREAPDTRFDSYVGTYNAQRAQVSGLHPYVHIVTFEAR